MSEQTEIEKKESGLEKESDKDKGKKKPARAVICAKEICGNAKNQEVTISKKDSSAPRKHCQNLLDVTLIPITTRVQRSLQGRRKMNQIRSYKVQRNLHYRRA